MRNRGLIVVLLVAIVAAGAMAEVKFSGGVTPYVYYDLNSSALSFEVTPSVSAAVGKATFTLGGDTCFNLEKFTSANVYAKAAVNLGFASAYLAPYFYMDKKFGLDTAVTFAIPHCPVTIEYTIGDGDDFAKGLVTAYASISF
jgi:hypothetical protein